MEKNLPQKLLLEFEKTCKQVRKSAKKHNVDLSKILIEKK